MLNQSSSSNTTFRPLSKRRRLNRRILCFSLVMGTFGVILTILVYLAAFYAEFRDAQIINQRALSQIKCSDFNCDSSLYTTDPTPGPDYILDTHTRYLLEAPP